MADAIRRLLLANGEQYVKEIDRKAFGRAPELPRPYPIARDHVKWELTAALDKLAEMSARKRFSDEAVLCLRLHPDLLAKSHDPSALFAEIRDLENVGSRSYRIPVKQVAETKRIKQMIQSKVEAVTGRLVFVRGDDAGFKRLLGVLDRSESQLHGAFKADIQRIEKFDLLSGDEQLQAFDTLPDWKEGRVELVFHPSLHTESEQMNFLGQLFKKQTSQPKLRTAQYSSGPLFVSCHVTRAILSEIAGANPLRTAHPLIFGGLEDLRGAPAFPAPPPPTGKTKSTLKVGIFDGGIDPLHLHLKGHCEQDDSLSIKTKPDLIGIAHGTAVAGAVLYGALNEHDTKVPLPSPAVSVVSVRALPTSDPKDIDLYECVDIIEAAVPQRPDVKTWNVSFGPRGPISDDRISRFSYALDLLAVTHKVGFTVAVGNDGEAGEDLHRIQAPSDLVNGLGVGAWTTRKGKVVHAPYSCRGPGRECAKLKPDLVAFGGCDQTPIHLISSTPGRKLLAHGTSFASPLVAALAGRAHGSFDRGTALLARALLVHTAEHPSDPDHLLGHGLVQPTLEQILRCTDKEVTILYQGELLATKHVKLPILLPPGLVTDGKLRVSWTVAALPPVNANHPADYTTLCIEDTFYPDSNVVTFTPPKGKKAKPRALHLERDAIEIAALESANWSQSVLPVSESGNNYQSQHESEARRLNYKWEPIVRRSVGKLGVNLHDPFIVLHAIPRHHATGRLDYAVVVTIAAPKYSGDLYHGIVTRFAALQPIRVRTEAELRVQI